jgi:hypothetical protein
MDKNYLGAVVHGGFSENTNCYFTPLEKQLSFIYGGRIEVLSSFLILLIYIYKKKASTFSN